MTCRTGVRQTHIWPFSADFLIDFDKIGVVAFQPKEVEAYSKIDFSELKQSNYSEDVIIINLNLIHMIDHTFPKIDRCCRRNSRKIEYDNIDNMERIECDMSQREFTRKYVDRREAVMMKGCQNEWKAKNWTIQNILDRYNFIKNDHFKWVTTYQKTIESTYQKEYLSSNEVKNAINAGYLVKVFHRLLKNLKGWIEWDSSKRFRLDLLEEYSFPKPMPEDKFYNFHVETDQSYLILATNGTGKFLRPNSPASTMDDNWKITNSSSGYVELSK